MYHIIQCSVICICVILLLSVITLKGCFVSCVCYNKQISNSKYNKSKRYDAYYFRNNYAI